MPGAGLVFSISQVTTLPASFDDDLRAYAEAGVNGIGIWEIKLADDDDAAAEERLRASGLVATNAVPVVPSILPLPLLPGPADPLERVDALCASIVRLARFEPTSIVFLTGPALGAADARATVVDGLKRIAEAADRAGVRAGVEPYQRIGGESWTIVNSIAEAADLLDEADTPNLGITFDVWHLWNTPTLFDDIRSHVGRITGVHICDYRSPTRGWADRVLPGEGIAVVPRILAALDDAGWGGPYDLEIFSDNGTFGNAYDDSLWNVAPAELAAQGKAAFESAWTARENYAQMSFSR